MKHQVFCHTISLGVYDSKHLLIDYFLIILLIHKNTKQILQSACFVLSCIKLKDFREIEKWTMFLVLGLFLMWQDLDVFLCFTWMCSRLWQYFEKGTINLLLGNTLLSYTSEVINSILWFFDGCGVVLLLLNNFVKLRMKNEENFIYFTGNLTDAFNMIMNKNEIL